MKSHCERPYRATISMAGTIRQISDTTTEWHIRRLAADLARAVFDLDARMRAGLLPPCSWRPAEHVDKPEEQVGTDEP